MKTKYGEMGGMYMYVNDKKFLTRKQKDLVDGKTEEIEEILKDELFDVIADFNSGRLERFSGDYSKRLSDNLSSGRNMPLYDTGDMVSNIDSIVERKANSILVSVFSTSEYAQLLNDGTDRIQAYMFMEIALDRAKDKITQLLSKGD